MRRSLSVLLGGILTAWVVGLGLWPAASVPRAEAAVVNLLPTYEGYWPERGDPSWWNYYGYRFLNGSTFWFDSDTTAVGITYWFAGFAIPASGGAEVRSMPDIALAAGQTYTLSLHYESHIVSGSSVTIGVARAGGAVLTSATVPLIHDSSYAFRIAAFTFVAPATASDYQLVFSAAGTNVNLPWDWMVLSQGSTPATNWVPGSGVAFNHAGFYYSDAFLGTAPLPGYYNYISLPDVATTGATIARMLVTTGTSSTSGTFGYCAPGTDSSNCQPVQLGNQPVYPAQWFSLPAGVTTIWTYYGGSSRYAEVLAILVVNHALPAPTATLTPGDWSNVAGRGDVRLSWPAVYGAQRYGVWVFDGYAYRFFDVGNATSWDSDIARIYPAESTLDGFPDNSQTGDLFNHVQGGLPLRDDPNKLYRKTAGTQYDGFHNYWFRVEAFNSDTGIDVGTEMSAPATPTLPNRTDASAPLITSVSIDGGAAKTGDQHVTVAVTVQDPAVSNYTSDPSDDASGVQWIRFSNDNQVWSNWQPLDANPTAPGASVTRTFDWTLGVLGQPNTVYVQVKDQAGNVSMTASAGIYWALDTTPPAVSLTANNGALTTSSGAVTLRVIATDDLSDPGSLQMRFSNDGLSWSAWEPYRSTKAWTLDTSTAGVKTVWAQARDAQGNVGTATASIVYMPTTGTGGGSILAARDGVPGTYVVNGASQSVVWLTSSQATLLVSPPTPSQRLMSLSFDGVSWTPFPELQGAGVEVPVSLPPGDGVRPVYARFADAQGATSLTYRVLFVVDTQPPVVRAFWQGHATVTDKGQQTLLLVAQDNLTAMQDLQVKIDVGSTQGTWQPFAGTYVVTFAQPGVNVVNVWVRDKAGNVGRTVLTIYN